MPAALYSRDEVVARLMQVIRRRGYDGASLAELSKATRLGKSSLYHYFPNGKDDMVRAVLDQLAVGLETNVFAPLRAPGDPRQRIVAMTRTVDEFYRQGEEPCVLAQLVLGSTHSRFRARLRTLFEAWVAAITAPLLEAGLTPAVARARAEDAVLRIEGALVLSGGLGTPGVFERTLHALPNSLLAPAD